MSSSEAMILKRDAGGRVVVPVARQIGSLCVLQPAAHAAQSALLRRHGAVANDQAAGTERSEIASRRLPEGRRPREARAEATRRVLLAEGGAGGAGFAGLHPHGQVLRSPAALSPATDRQVAAWHRVVAPGHVALGGAGGRVAAAHLSNHPRRHVGGWVCADQ